MTEFNPLAEFQTPEWNQRNPWEKVLRFQQVFPNIPVYAEADTGVREQMRNQALGYKTSDELYRDVFSWMKQNGRDPVEQQQVFNSLMVDDQAYEQWDLPIKQQFRQGLIGAMEEQGTQMPMQPVGQELPPRFAGDVPTPEQAVEGLVDQAATQQYAQQRDLARGAQQLKRELLYKALPGGMRQGAEFIFGGAEKLAEGDQYAGIPVVREFAAPWFRRAANSPGEVLDTTANLIAKAEQAQAEFRNTSDRLKRVRLHSEGVSEDQLPPELLASKADPSVNEIEQVREFAKKLHGEAGRWLDFTNAAVPGREVARATDVDWKDPVSVTKYMAGTLGDTSSFMAQVAIGQTVGGGFGGWLAAAIPSVSEVSQEIRRATGGEMHPDLALPMGFAIASLEKAGFEVVGGAFTTPVRRMVRNKIASRFIDGATRMLGEGGTELTQEELTMQAGWAALSPAEQEELRAAGIDEERYTRLVNAFSAGFFGAGGLTGMGQFYQYLTDDQRAEIDSIRQNIDPEALESIDNLARTAAAVDLQLDSEVGPSVEYVTDAFGRPVYNTNAEATAQAQEMIPPEQPQEAVPEQPAEPEMSADAQFIAEHPELQDMINQRDPEALAEAFGMPLERAQQLIREHAQPLEEELPPAEELPSGLFAQPEMPGAIVLDENGQPVETGRPLEETLGEVTPEPQAEQPGSERVTASKLQVGDQVMYGEDIVAVTQIESGERGQRTITFENGERDIVSPRTNFDRVNVETEAEPRREIPAERVDRTPQEQIAVLDQRLGEGVGAVKERARLAEQMEKEPPIEPRRNVPPLEPSPRVPTEQVESVRSSELQPGDQVIVGDGQIITVQSVETGERAQRVITFDNGEVDTVSPRTKYNRRTQQAPEQEQQLGPEFVPPTAQEQRLDLPPDRRFKPPPQEPTKEEAPEPISPGEAIRRLNEYGESDAAFAAAILAAGDDLTLDQRAELDRVMEMSRRGEIDEFVAPAIETMLQERLTEAETVKKKAAEKRKAAEKAKAEPEEEAQTPEEMTLEDRVLAAMDAGEGTARSIADSLGEPIGAVRRVLNTLANEGKAERTGTGSTKSPFVFNHPKGSERRKASPQKERLDEMAREYEAMVEAANTEEELDAVAELWAREKVRPYKIGLEGKIRRKRAIVRKFGKPRGEAKEEAPAEEQETKKEETPKDEGKKKKKRKKKKSKAEKKAERQALNEKEDAAVLEAVNNGATLVKEITEQTGIPHATVRGVIRRLSNAGKIKAVLIPNEDKPGKHWEVGKVEEGKEAEAKKENKKAREEFKEEEKAKEEAEKEKEDTRTAREKILDEFDDPDPVKTEREERDKASEKGSITLLPDKTAQKKDSEARRERGTWAIRRFLDILMSGGRKRKKGPDEGGIFGFTIQPVMSRGALRAWRNAIAEVHAGFREGVLINKVLDRMLQKMTRSKKDRLRYGKLISGYVNGHITIEDLTGKIGDKLPNGALTDLKELKRRKAELQEKFKNIELLPNRIRVLLEEQDYYARLAYRRYLENGAGIIGRMFRYKPSASDKKDAADTIVVDYKKAIRKLGKEVHQIQEEIPEDFDLIDFFERDDQKGLSELDADVADRLLLLRQQLHKHRQGLEFIEAVNGDRVAVVASIDGIRDMAEQTVRNLLVNKPRRGEGGKLDISNLQARTLTEVFRKLYGEIEEVSLIEALSVETQVGVLAYNNFFNEMLRNGKDLMWSSSDINDLGHTEPLGSVENEDDVFRYGAMTGKFVSPEFKDFLDRKGVIQSGIADAFELDTLDTSKFMAALGKGFMTAQATMRSFALMTFGAISRNYMTAPLQFAMGCGDFFLPGFAKEFGKNSIRMMALILGSTNAQKELVKDMRKGAFRYTQSSIVSDFTPILSGIVRASTERDSVLFEKTIKAFYQLKSLPKRLKEGYILIDYAAKKASWEARKQYALDHGKSEEVAEEYAAWWVETFYQNSDKVPEWVSAIGRVGMVDFGGFVYDSGRMGVNTAVMLGVSMRGKKAAEPGTKLHEWMGMLNEHPDLIDEAWRHLAGFTSARTLALFAGAYGAGQYLFLSKTAAAKISMTAAFVMSKMGWDNEPEKKKEATPKEISAALNSWLPIYDARAIRWEWKVNDEKTGEKKLVIVPLTSQFGNAFEEALLGYLQRFTSAGESLDDVLESMLTMENLGEVAPMGMMWSSIYEAITGFDPQTKTKQQGLADAYNAATGDKRIEALTTMAMNLMADTTGGFGRGWKKYVQQERQAGRTPRPGTYLEEAGSSMEEYWEVMKPVLRMLRPVEITKEKALYALPSRVAYDIQAVAEYKVLRGVAARAGKTYKEGATEDEIAESIDAEKNYQNRMLAFEAKMKRLKPMFEYLEIDDEELIGRLLSKNKTPLQHNLSRAEISAAVYGEVEEYFESEEYYMPDPKDTSDTKGDTLMRSWLTQDLYRSPKSIFNGLKNKGFEPGDYDAFLLRWSNARDQIWENEILKPQKVQ